MEEGPEPYHHVRYTWAKLHRNSDLVEEFRRDYDLTLPIFRPEEMTDLSPYKGHRWEVLAKADTLAVYMGSTRAVLFQRHWGRFTRKDLALRQAVFKLYTHKTPSPFPWGYNPEPPFLTEE